MDSLFSHSRHGKRDYETTQNFFFCDKNNLMLLFKQTEDLSDQETAEVHKTTSNKLLKILLSTFFLLNGGKSIYHV